MIINIFQWCIKGKCVFSEKAPSKSREYHIILFQAKAGCPDNSTKNHKSIGSLSNTGLDPLKNHKATKPAFTVGPSSARQ